eukprot:XP_004920580.3 PREDICTED: probable cation-transporting ATPase 13A4 isoform X1 [Xenopus tropicalis]
MGYIFSFGLLWLLFYWKPEWEVWAFCEPCLLENANVFLLRSTDEFKHCSKKNLLWTHLSKQDSVLLQTSDKLSTKDEYSIINKAIMMPEHKVRYIRVQKIKYVWLLSEKKFQKAGALEDLYSCSQIHSRFGSGLTQEEQTLRYIYLVIMFCLSLTPITKHNKCKICTGNPWQPINFCSVLQIE